MDCQSGEVFAQEDEAKLSLFFTEEEDEVGTSSTNTDIFLFVFD